MHDLLLSMIGVAALGLAVPAAAQSAPPLAKPSSTPPATIARQPMTTPVTGNGASNPKGAVVLTGTQQPPPFVPQPLTVRYLQDPAFPVSLVAEGMTFSCAPEAGAPTPVIRCVGRRTRSMSISMRSTGKPRRWRRWCPKCPASSGAEPVPAPSATVADSPWPDLKPSGSTSTPSLECVSRLCRSRYCPSGSGLGCLTMKAGGNSDDEGMRLTGVAKLDSIHAGASDRFGIVAWVERIAARRQPWSMKSMIALVLSIAGASAGIFGGYSEISGA